MERVRGVPRGVERQVIGEHSGNEVLDSKMKSVDNRDNRMKYQSENPHEFVCTKLVHFTENIFAARIGLSDTEQYFCFKPFPWHKNEKNSLKLTWWSPLPPDNWKEELNRNEFHDFNSLGNSPAIGGDKLCGPIGFVIPWKDLLEKYANGRRQSSRSSEVELRNLGTYKYTSEIMYAVLVCIKGDINVNRYPVITSDDGTETISFKNNSYSDEFTWKVYSTSSFYRRHTFSKNPWTWDHLTFAFQLPTSKFRLKNTTTNL